MDSTSMNKDEIIENYFSTMNPLSSRIYADVVEVEKSIQEQYKSCPFNERCAIIDKSLIDDIVQKTCQKDNDNQDCNDDDRTSHILSDSDYATDLLIDMCSKNGEIIPKTTLFSDNNELENQFRHCNVTKLIKNSKGRMMEKKIAKQGGVFVGLKDKSTTKDIKGSKTMSVNDVSGADNDNSNVQPQNFGLIAELQEKFRKNKLNQNQNQGTSPKKRPRKPKAPPPPPPVCQKSESENNLSKPSNVPPPSAQSKSAAQTKIDEEIQDFVVDVSSPCKIATPKTGLEILDNW